MTEKLLSALYSGLGTFACARSLSNVLNNMLCTNSSYCTIYYTKAPGSEEALFDCPITLATRPDFLSSNFPIPALKWNIFSKMPHICCPCVQLLKYNAKFSYKKKSAAYRPVTSQVLCCVTHIWIVDHLMHIHHPKATLTDIFVPSAALCLQQADTPLVKLYILSLTVLLGTRLRCVNFGL